jgi:predicted metal-dependent HD superfamily phosphohydrolase
VELWVGVSEPCSGLLYTLLRRKKAAKPRIKGDLNMTNTVMQEMILYFKDDIKRITHALKVYAFARLLGQMEGLSAEKQDILEMAAILHDIGIHEAQRKHGSTTGNYQEVEGPPIAEGILKKCMVAEAIIPRVLYLVGNHHSYQKIDDADFQILVEADFLVNIFEDSMSGASVASIIRKYFKTAGGIKLAISMYPLG